MSCDICERIERAEASWTVRGQAAVVVSTQRAGDAIGTAYIAGFALGFMLRTEATYTEFCAKHAEEMKAALLAAGAKPLGVTRRVSE